MLKVYGAGLSSPCIKVRLVANDVSGKRVDKALAILEHMPKRASTPLAKLIRSAVFNAGKNEQAFGSLVIDIIDVGKGVVLKRSRPRARGSAYPVHKHTSHVTVILREE